jgi:hypothetical protein
MTNSPTKFGFNLEDSQTPQIINIPNNQALPPINPTFGPAPVQTQDSMFKVSAARKKLKFIKWSLIPLSLMQLIFIAPEAYPLILTILFPIIGLIGVFKLNSYCIRLFGIYLILLILVQVITMIILRGVAYIVIQTLFIIYEILCSYVCLKAASGMDGLNSSEFDSLKS